MMDTGSEDGHGSKPNTTNLFPITHQDSSIQGGHLFPAFSGRSTDSGVSASHGAKPDLDWLENSSFKSQDAVLIHQLRTIREAVSSQQKDDSNESFSSLPGRRTTKRDHSQSPESTSASSNDGSPERKKHKVKKEKKKKKKKKKHKHKSHSKSDHVKSLETSSSQENHLKEVPGAKGKVFREDLAGLNVTLFFRVDRMPDANNITYGSLYKLHIAKYHRVGTSALGVTGNAKFFGGSKSHSHGKLMGRYHYRQNRIPQDHSEGWVVNAVDSPQNEFGNSVHSVGINQEFIAIGSDVNKAEPSEVNPLGIYDSSTERYLQGPEKVKEEEIQQMGPKTESHNEYLRRKTAEYNSHLYKNPHDIDKWLEFVKFQEDSAPVISDRDTGKRKLAEKNLLEIKASVMDKALQKNPGCIRLRLAQIEQCVPLWESDRTAKEWNQLLFLHPNNPTVWRHYLQFQCSQFGRFTVSRVVKSYAKCLGKLDQMRSGHIQSHKPHPGTEQHMVSIFCELCLLVWQAGHMERATALFQSMLELNINCPAVLLDQNLAQRKEFLEAFWGSSAPRLGEDEAQGWDTWVDAKGGVPNKATYIRDEEERTEEEVLKSVMDVPNVKAWKALESSRVSRHWLPWRPDFSLGENEEDCEDPDRLVLFDDVAGCLFLVSSEASRLELVVRFLEMLGTPASWGSPASSPLVQSNLRSSLVCLQQISSESESFLLPACQPVRLDHHLRMQLITNVILQTIPKFPSAAKSKLLVNLIRQKVKDFEQRYSGLQGKELKRQVKELRSYVKGVLKEEPARSDLLVWKAYAQVEWKHGSKDDAYKVMDNAISMFIPSITDVSENYSHSVACSLYRTYAEMVLGLHNGTQQNKIIVDKKQKHKALYIVASLASGEKYKPLDKASGDSICGSDVVTGTKILKARRNYQHYLDQLIGQVQAGTGQPLWDEKVLSLPEAGSVLVPWTACYALFQYLNVDISAATAVYQQILRQLEPSDGVEGKQAGEEWDCWSDGHLWSYWLYEQIYINFVNFLHYHLTTGVCPLQTVRGPILDALAKMPDQPSLLQLYTSLESGMGVTSQLRQQLYRLASSSKTPLPWLYGVLAELRRLHKRKQHALEGMDSSSLSGIAFEPSTQYQLRAWFEKSVSEPVGRCCVLLWRLYIHTEAQQGNLQYARSVFYRAVQQCPWAKVLYMDLIEHFPDQLQEAMDLMAEKELRVRTPLEELTLLLDSARNPPDPMDDELGKAEILEQELMDNKPQHQEPDSVDNTLLDPGAVKLK